MSRETDAPVEDKAYYSGKEATLKEIFGAKKISVNCEEISVDDKIFPIVDDVIIIKGENKEKLDNLGAETVHSFSAEWESFPEILPEHKSEFSLYFDLFDLHDLKNKRCLDLGCGIGRWSYFLSDYTDRLVLCDASRAIFVARENLRDRPGIIFVQCDLRKLPFSDGAFDLVYCLGVLHHLEEDCLDLTRSLGRLSDDLLIYLYYAVDNRPFYFRLLFSLANNLRSHLYKIKHEPTRRALAALITALIYYPFIMIGRAASRIGLGSFVPLYEFYAPLSFKRIAQDAYDRFFTPIEQRITRKQIQDLSNRFDEISISDGLPYWHFRLRKQEFDGAQSRRSRSSIGDDA